MKYYLFTILILFTSYSHDPSLTLDITKEWFEVVQHIHPDSEGRDINTLYQMPREIEQEEFGSDELAIFIDSLYSVMISKAGVGIAANQVGKRLQIFIIEAKSDNPRYKVLGPVPKQIFINPIITAVSNDRMNFWHGCLSAVGEMRGNVATYKWIDYQSKNENGEIIEGRLEGFASVIFQHEFRHMLGGTYLDYAVDFLPKDELDSEIDAGNKPFFELAPDSLPLLLKDYTIEETIEQNFKKRKN
ncbi:MAG: hypothetical protein Kapaf2KO_17800 [Candidatus Kapaibacteriales bacterium]